MPMRAARRLSICAFILYAVVLPGCGSNSNVGSSSDGTTTPTAGQNKVDSSLPSLLVNGVSKMAMHGCASFDYFVNVLVGNQYFSMLVDSGSTTLALAESTCKDCDTANTYLSTTGKKTGKMTSSAYVDGSSWRGNVWRDTVAIGDGNGRATAGALVDFAAITDQNDFFESVSCQELDDTPFDGILGLGPDTQLEAGTSSLLTEEAKAKTLKQNLFALQTCDIGGSIWFGGFDAAATTDAPFYTPLLPATNSNPITRAYAINVSAMALGGQDLGLSQKSLGPMVVDNGTSILILFPAAFDQLVSALEDNPVYQQNFPAGFINATTRSCVAPAKGLTREQLDAQLPKLTFSFPTTDGKTGSITLPATSSYLLAGASVRRGVASTVYCGSVTSNPDVSLFGNTVMREHIVIFDRDNQRIGFAPQTGCKKGLPLLYLQN